MALRLFKTAVVPLVSEGKPRMERDGMVDISSFRWLFFCSQSLWWYSYRKEFAPVKEQILFCMSTIENKWIQKIGQIIPACQFPFHSNESITWLVMSHLICIYNVYPQSLTLSWGGRVVRWCWVNFQCRGVLRLNLDYSRARAYCACSSCGWGLFGHFYSHLSFLSPFSLSLGGGPI